MDNIQNLDKGVSSSKVLAEATATRKSLHFEPMTQYKGTHDEADLARFGKQQQLDVRHGNTGS